MIIRVNAEGMKFRALTEEQQNFLKGLKVGRHVIDGETVKAVRESLELEFLNNEGLTATRNSVVRYLGEIEDEYAENDNFEMAMQMATNISGVTAVIDQQLFEQGGLY